MPEEIASVSSGLEKDFAVKFSFEDAMTITGFGKFNIIIVFFCGFMLLGMILETLGFSYIIPACQCDLMLTLSDKTWLPVIPFVAIILTSHMWGYLADTKGRKKVLTLCMGVGSFFSVLSSFSPDLVTFAALRFIAGIFIAGPSALGYAYLGEMNPKLHRDKMVALGNASVALGTAVVPLIAWGILPTDFKLHLMYIDYRPWRLLICLFALPYAICAILMFKFPESPKFLISQGRMDDSLDVLKYIYSVNEGLKASEFPVKHLKIEGVHSDRKESFLKDVWKQTVPLLSSKYRLYTLITCLMQFVVFATTNGFYIWFPEILNTVLQNNENALHEGKTICGLLEDESAHFDLNNTTDPSGDTICNDTLNTSTFTIAILLSCFVSFVTVVSAFVIRVFGKKNMLIGFLTFAALACLVLNWIPETWSAITVFSMIQISGTCIGLINAYVIEIFPTNVRAMAVCLTLMVGRVGSMFGTNIIGILIHSVCPASFFMFSGLLFASVALTFTLPATDSQKERKTSQTNQETVTSL